MSAHAVGVHTNIQMAIQENGSSHVAFDDEARLFQYRPPSNELMQEDPDLARTWIRNTLIANPATFRTPAETFWFNNQHWPEIGIYTTTRAGRI